MQRRGGEVGGEDEAERSARGSGWRRRNVEEFTCLPVVAQKALRRRPNLSKKFSCWAKAKPSVPSPLSNNNKFINKHYLCTYGRLLYRILSNIK